MILLYLFIYSCYIIIVQMDEDSSSNGTQLCNSRNYFDLNKLPKEGTIILYEKWLFIFIFYIQMCFFFYKILVTI